MEKPYVWVRKSFKFCTHSQIKLKKIFTKEDLYETVWEAPYLSGDNTLNAQLSNLRKKLAQVDGSSEYIETIWGLGVRLKGMTHERTTYCIDSTLLGVTIYLVRYYLAVKSLSKQIEEKLLEESHRRITLKTSQNL